MATAKSTTLEMQDIAAFASALDVVPAASWPPPLHDAGSQGWYLDLLQQDDAVGWGLWYLVVPQNERQLVGTVAFKGKPHDGSCEIGYSVPLGFEGFGYATEAARRLIEWAFEHPEVEQVTAETLPDLAGSIRVMEKCGMRFVGEGTPEGDVRTVRYAVSRAEFRSIADSRHMARNPTAGWLDRTALTKTSSSSARGGTKGAQSQNPA